MEHEIFKKIIARSILPFIVVGGTLVAIRAGKYSLSQLLTDWVLAGVIYLILAWLYAALRAKYIKKGG